MGFSASSVQLFGFLLSGLFGGQDWQVLWLGLTIFFVLIDYKPTITLT